MQTTVESRILAGSTVSRASSIATSDKGPVRHSGRGCIFCNRDGMSVVTSLAVAGYIESRPIVRVLNFMVDKKYLSRWPSGYNSVKWGCRCRDPASRE